MKREVLTKKLERIFSTIESDQIPVVVRKVWVFGSYARGAPNCGDLDLVILTDPPSEEQVERVTGLPWTLDSWRKFQQQVDYLFKRRGERIDIIIKWTEESVQEFFQGVPIDDAILLWSEEDRKWREKVDMIEVDPTAGRFERSYPIELKRTRTNRWILEDVLALVEKDCLTLETIEIDSFEPTVTPEQAARIENWCRSGMGKETASVMPHVLGWLDREGQDLPRFCSSHTEIISESETHLVHVGKINFGYALGWLYREAKAQKLCLAPHLRKRSENKMFVLQRGEHWTGDVRRDLEEPKQYTDSQAHQGPVDGDVVADRGNHV